MCAVVWPCPTCDLGWCEGDEEQCDSCNPYRQFCRMWQVVAEYRNGLRCRICHRQWYADPGKMYCAGSHGLCGICNKPRGGCKCLRTELA